MNKLTKILILFSFLIIALITGVYFVTSSPTTIASLIVEQGNIQVDQGKGYTQAENNMKLSLDDKVRTLDGEASVIFHESVVVHIDPNTEIAMTDLSKDLKIKQSNGFTWTKFTRITGVTGMVIETPNTVATVRGTEFGVTNTKVLVGEGQVEVKKDSNVLLVKQGKKAEVTEDKLSESDLSKEEKQAVLKNMQKTLKSLRQVREQEINKHRWLIKLFSDKINDEKIKEIAEQLDSGKIDPENYKEEIKKYTKLLPVNKKSIDKLFNLNKVIREQVLLIESFDKQ